MRATIGVVILFAFGCSEPLSASAPVPAVCGAVGADGQLDTQAPSSLVVAPDERHVAFLRNPYSFEAGCLSRGARLEVGTLVALELQSDGSACQRAVADNVYGYSIYYSSDSRDLVFMDDVDDCAVGTLKAVDADGTNLRLVSRSVSSNVGIGATVFFTLRGQDKDLAAPMAGGKTITLGPHLDFDEPRSASNAAGTASTYRKYGTDQNFPEGLVLAQLPSGKSQTLVDGVTETVGNHIWSPGGNWLAFCHYPRSSWTLAFLTVVSADGSTRMDVSSNSDCYAFTFSPDDAWLAYADLDASGGTRLLTYSLEERSSVALGKMAEGYFELAFGDDSASVVATVDSTTKTTGATIYAARAGVADSIQFLADTTAYPESIVSAGGHVALATVDWTTSPSGYRTVGVYPVSGGAPVTIPGTRPLFEPGVAQPHLLLLQYQPSTIAIAATDGTAVTSRAVPGFIAFATWLGSAAVHGAAPDPYSLVTISALTSAGAVTSLLASEVGAYAWAPVAAPTRLFYSRELASAGGPAGVFYTDVPR